MFVSPHALLGTSSCSGSGARRAELLGVGVPKIPALQGFHLSLDGIFSLPKGGWTKGVALLWILPEVMGWQGHAVQCPQTWWRWPMEPSCGSLRIPWNSPATAPGKVAAPALAGAHDPHQCGYSWKLPFPVDADPEGEDFPGAAGTHELIQALFQSP